MVNKLRHFIVIGVLASLLFAPLTTSYAEQETTVEQQENLTREQEQKKLIEEIYDLLLEYHLNDPSAEQLTEWAIIGMIASLDDPYTTYFTPAEVEQFVNDVDGAYVGVGIMIEMIENTLVISKVFDDTPAAQAGLQGGDVITHINGAAVQDMTLDEASSKIKGIEGTTVTLTIQREDETRQTVELERKQIRIPSVEIRMLDDEVGLMTLHTFSHDLFPTFEEKLEALKEQGMQKMILDLRGNSGGYLDSAYEVIQMFREEGVAVHLRNKWWEYETIYIEDGKPFDLPLVVLVDPLTASASELVAGFLQDYNVGTVVGQQTYGKGVVQMMVDLEYGGALRFTFEEYYTPYMGKVHEEGITPDVVVESPIFNLGLAYKELTGKDEVWVSDRGEILWNGLRDEYLRSDLRAHVEDERIYIPLRQVMEWFGAEVTWNDALQTVDVIADQKHTLPRDEKVWKTIDSTGYLALDQMSEYLPFHVEQRDGAYIITRR